MLIFITLLVFLLIIGVIIFIHELGHFLAAKRSGVKVEEFAFGFPPRLIAWKKKDTVYAINLIPLGGYVKMLGEEKEIKNKHSFSEQPARKRAFILISGVLMNFILAWLILTIWFWISSGSELKNYVVIAQVNKDTVAEQNNLKQGDLIININGQAITSADQLSEITKVNRGKEVTIDYRRYGQTKEVTTLLPDKEYPLGVATVDSSEGEQVVWWKAPYYSLIFLFDYCWVSLLAIGTFIKSLFISARVPIEVSGPVGIGGWLSQMISMGFTYVFRFAAILSLAVGFFNILPIPALDGGRLVFVIAEGISRRKLIKAEIENIIHTFGFVLLIILLILITYRDIITLIVKK